MNKGDGLDLGQAFIFTWARLENINFNIIQNLNGSPRLYPSLPGVEGAQGTPAGGPEARLASLTKKLVRMVLNYS